VKEQKLEYLAVPKFISSGLHDFSRKKFRFMVMERFGTDLHSCFQGCGRFCEDSVCYLAQRLVGGSLRVLWVWFKCMCS